MSKTEVDETCLGAAANGRTLSVEYVNPVYLNEHAPGTTDDSPSRKSVTSIGSPPSDDHGLDDHGDIVFAIRLADDVDADIQSLHSTVPMRRSASPRLLARLEKIGYDDASRVNDDDLQHTELILKIRKTLPLKDFIEEIRARRDLERFLVKPVVVLDVHHTSLFKIMEEILSKLKNDLDVDEKMTAQAAKAFFTYQEEYPDSLGSVDHLQQTIQGISYKASHADFEESWVTAVCSLPSLKKSHVAIARLRHPLNLGQKSEEVKFVIAVIAPQKEKFTKNAVEIGRTFSSLMFDPDFRSQLAGAENEEECKEIFQQVHERFREVARERRRSRMDGKSEQDSAVTNYSCLMLGRGIWDDLKRRLPHYWSDYADGVKGKNTLSKLFATVFFLYFACILPDIAFGALYEKNTDGRMDVTSCIVSQTIGGLFFALFAGQPMLILLTTAPLALYVKVINLVCESFDLEFRAMYALVGIWNSIFLFLEAAFNLSKFMKYSTRSTEEIFGFFIALAFTADAVKATIINFNKNYHFPPAENLNATLLSNLSSSYAKDCVSKELCYRPENSILFLFLMLGTLWLSISLLRFDQSQFLSAAKRTLLADYALPISVVFFSFLGSYVFRQVDLEEFSYNATRGIEFNLAPMGGLPIGAHFGAMGLGLSLSFLFFVDQNVSAAFVNAPHNKLRKGPAYHWDLVVVAIINGFLSIFNLPWVHAALPHSPLHVRALADVEQHLSSVGTVHDEIVRVRETRLSSLISHVLIGLSLLFIKQLQYIPVSVLQGLFLYLGLSSFIGNQMFERMELLFTEGSSYPPNHYVRKVPLRTLHGFTAIQALQLAIVAFFGFADYFYLKMIFPCIILLLMPTRHLLLPRLFARKYLQVLDSDS